VTKQRTGQPVQADAVEQDCRHVASCCHSSLAAAGLRRQHRIENYPHKHAPMDNVVMSCGSSSPGTCEQEQGIRLAVRAQPQDDAFRAVQRQGGRDCYGTSNLRSPAARVDGACTAGCTVESAI
jgi:hypothetical protein